MRPETTLGLFTLNLGTPLETSSTSVHVRDLSTGTPVADITLFGPPDENGDPTSPGVLGAPVRLPGGDIVFTGQNPIEIFRQPPVGDTVQIGGPFPSGDGEEYDSLRLIGCAADSQFYLRSHAESEFVVRRGPGADELFRVSSELSNSPQSSIPSLSSFGGTAENVYLPFDGAMVAAHIDTGERFADFAVSELGAFGQVAPPAIPATEAT